MAIRTNEYKIRAVELSDVPQLSEVGRFSFQEAFGDTNSTEDMEVYLDRSFNLDILKRQILKGNIFYLAESVSMAVGYFKLLHGPKVPEVDNLNCIQLERIYVRKECYGLGLGAALMKTAIDYCVIHKIDYLWLGVWQENQRAITFYENFGFEKVGTKLFKIGENVTEDFVMLLKIKS